MARLDTVEEAGQALDELRPDWFKQIDTEILDMDWSKKCILGQLYGNYYDAPASLVYTGHTWNSSLNAVFLECRYEREWLVEIKKRVRRRPTPHTPKNDDSLSDFKEQVRDMLIGDLSADHPAMRDAQLAVLGLRPYKG